MACKESICRNCFHSYVCEQFNENKDDNNEKCHFYNDHYVPTADVVPKSEVEELKGELAIAERHEKDARALFKDAVIQLQNAKAEVAREIFEEIESIFNKKKYVPYPLDVLAELKKKYTEKLK